MLKYSILPNITMFYQAFKLGRTNSFTRNQLALTSTGILRKAQTWFGIRLRARIMGAKFQSEILLPSS